MSVDTTEPSGKKYTRIEIIDHTDTGTGREYTKWVSIPFNVELQEQDDGRTLKIFLTDYKPMEEK